MAETFKQDAMVIAEAMTKGIKSATSNNDPVKEYAFMAAENLVDVLGADMAKFLPDFLPEVFAKLQTRPVGSDKLAELTQGVSISIQVLGITFATD